MKEYGKKDYEGGVWAEGVWGKEYVVKECGGKRVCG